ncbi:MAG: hypothetical protein MI739_11200, partial [Bacteroidales bacterium]|nr:hypothetical protein [Bacteroidales bacterium]
MYPKTKFIRYYFVVLLLFISSVGFAQNNKPQETISDDSVQVLKAKVRTFFDELFMFEEAQHVIEARQLVSNKELGDSVQKHIKDYNNALFFISKVDINFFWNRVLNRKKYVVPSRKMFLDSKDKYLRKNTPASSIDFDIVLTPQWEDPQRKTDVKDYKINIKPHNYTKLTFSSEQKNNFKKVLNTPLKASYKTPKEAEVNKDVFAGLGELRNLLKTTSKPANIKLDL